MTSDPVWLEVALNGAAGTALQPNVPVEPSQIIEEAIACVEAGASIVHLHAYRDGQAVEDASIYASIFEGIRKHCDAILYPTLALTGSLEERLKPLRELGESGLMEWTVVDPGSVNISLQLQIDAGLPGIHYSNPDEHIRAGLELAKERGWRPAYAIYEPGFVRLGSAFAASITGMQQPIYRLMFSKSLLFGASPTEYALAFYYEHLQEHAPGSPWMISGLDADISAIAPSALKLGAHLRVGLEDAPFHSEKNNLQLVREAIEWIGMSERPLATVQQIRAAT